MGMIKRMLRRTSRKLLAKIAPPPHELVLNPPLEPEHIASPTDSKHARRLAKKYRKSIKNSAVAEALLLAVKNHLPAVQFHHVHGPNIQLTKNKCVARRTQSFCQALVFSNRVILPNERVYIKVLEIAKGWSGTIRFGFTAVDPATLACRMPKHACPDMTNAGHTWARALADEVVRRNSVIHFSYNKNGLIHYGINNQDCGVFHANIGTNQNLWFIVDIYGLTAAVELIDPRVNSASSETDISQLDDDSHRTGAGGALSRSTMFKSTTAMEELFGLYGGPSEGRLRSKQSRKLAARRAAMIQNNWAFEHSIGAPFLNFNNSNNSQRRHYVAQEMQLPNLNAINLPSAQQNIYSPLPESSSSSSDSPTTTRGPVNNSNEIHDYYQIYSKTNAANLTYPQHNNTAAGVAQTRLNNDANSSCPNTSLPVASTSMPTTLNSASQIELELSQRFENIHINDRHQSRRPQHSTPKSQSRPSAGTQVVVAPVAAIRRRIPQQRQQQQQQQQACVDQTKVLKQAHPDAPDKATVANRLRSGGKSQASSASKSTAVAASNGHERSRARHSIKNQRLATSLDRDKNNNSPPSKDCPICFERPINCVLYQCGHMCTCYECGVKQWKTQSRTCPICRTVIKDVIKTYMS